MWHFLIEKVSHAHAFSLSLLPPLAVILTSHVGGVVVYYALICDEPEGVMAPCGGGSGELSSCSTSRGDTYSKHDRVSYAPTPLEDSHAHSPLRNNQAPSSSRTSCTPTPPGYSS
ncbi:hypothetical protein VNO78_18283 [Psophocarpus tetragonolobus]|uniref:Uncharacterized protein n=1 Tax=Psophocarpus tetragonolobus TaxID=3891 RepID=A0AAN9SJJ6_PSOTE